MERLPRRVGTGRERWASVVWGMSPFHYYWSGVINKFTETSAVWGVVEESGWLKLEATDIFDRSAKDSIYVTVWDDMPDDLI